MINNRIEKKLLIKNNTNRIIHSTRKHDKDTKPSARGIQHLSSTNMNKTKWFHAKTTLVKCSLNPKKQTKSTIDTYQIQATKNSPHHHHPKTSKPNSRQKKQQVVLHGAIGVVAVMAKFALWYSDCDPS